MADCEQRMEDAERDVELYRMNKFREIFANRDGILCQIPNFWQIVLSQNVDFANYIRASDFKYIDAIDSLVVKWTSPTEYDIIFKFKEIEGEFESQTLQKHFVSRNDKLTSEAIEIQYPKSKVRGNGTKSFFDWFRWTGSENLKEFANGDDFAILISEEIYPYCVKFYTEAQRDLIDEESCTDSSEGELLPDEN